MILGSFLERKNEHGNLGDSFSYRNKTRILDPGARVLYRINTGHQPAIVNTICGCDILVSTRFLTLNYRHSITKCLSENASMTIFSVEMEELQRHVHRLAVDIGERHIGLPAKLHEAGNYIRQMWTEQGYEVTPYTYVAQDVESTNFEISIPGVHNPEEVILIGAHYDSVIGCPAANDNGSGIAALLALSRSMRHIAPAVTVRFVAFVNEEPPFFYWGNMGSMIYARLAKQRGDKIRFMVSLETIGYYSDQPRSQAYPPVLKHFYPDTGNFVAFVSNMRSRAVMRQAVKAYKAVSEFPIEHIATLAAIPGVSWSDHLSFWRQGYKAFMVTDTAFYRYPYYHTPMDTYEKLNYPRFTHMCTGLLNMFVRLSQHQ